MKSHDVIFSVPIKCILHLFWIINIVDIQHLMNIQKRGEHVTPVGKTGTDASAERLGKQRLTFNSQ